MRLKLNESLKEKQKELKNYIISELNNNENSENIANVIIDSFCEMTAPTQVTEIGTPGDLNFTLTIYDNPSGLRGSESIKNGNIFLSWKRLLFDSAEHTLTLVGAVTTSILAPVVIPFAALVVWNKIYSLRKIKIEERHAMVLSVLWQNRNVENDIVSNEGIIDKINEVLVNYDRPKIASEEYTLLVNDLASFEVLKQNADGTIWLRDKVKIPYH